MAKARILFFLSFVSLLSIGLIGNPRGLLAQSTTDSGTPASGTPEAGTQQDTIWFVIAPDGKSNGDYFDVELKAGESAMLSGVIGNGSDIPVNAIIYAADAYSGTNGGFVLKESDEAVSAPTTWLDFPTTTREFQPKEAVQSSFKVTVPEGTPPGQYITGIAVETADSRPMPGSAPLMVRYRLVAAVLITVPGDVTPGFELSNISMTADGQSTTITGGITNTGNIRVRPTGSLTVADANGTQVVDAPIEMQSVYAGDETTYQIIIPTPLAEGDYTVSVDLSDPDTGTSASLHDVVVHAEKPAAPGPVTISAAAFTPMPSADDIVFVQVSATISNTSSPQTGAEVTLRVYRDGTQVDEKVLATAMTLQTGDTPVDQPYIPASGKWESGSYTFEVVLSIVDPSTGTRSEIVTMKSDTEIVVP